MRAPCIALLVLAACARDRGEAGARADASVERAIEAEIDLRPGADALAPVSIEAPRSGREDTRAYLPAKTLSVALGDLAEIRARGELRVLVRGEGDEFLPRAGMPALEDMELAEAFARHLGVKAVFALAVGYESLLSSLVGGRGDIVAAQLTVTKDRRSRVAFARSVIGVQELLVGKKGAKGLPRTAKELKGKTVHVHRGSAYVESLERLKKEAAPELQIRFVPAHEDTEQIVFSVTKGERELTVVDSHLLGAIETYNDGVERLFPVADDREIAWAVRREATQLKAAIDEFMIERAMTLDSSRPRSPDLDGIKETGVLRVITRNNAVTYFLHKGRRLGFDYELAEMMADDLGVRLEIVVPPSRDLLIPWLVEGRGDLVAASMTNTSSRAERAEFSAPYLYVDEVLVKRLGAEGPRTVEELDGREVHVRRSSSYFDTLEGIRRRGVDVRIVEVAEELETEELIHRVATGEIPLTVADSHIFKAELTYGTAVELAFPLGAKEIGFVLRKESARLKTYADSFVKASYRGLRYNMARSRYFQNKKGIAQAKTESAGKSGVLSPYDDLIKKYSKQYGLDWRLMAAQAYAESGFDPEAKSWVGAVGLFQVMPRTGAALGFTNLRDPEQGVHAGIKYMSELVGRFDPKIVFKERMYFALAAYNAGLGHVIDARRLAEHEKRDKARWFGHVEQTMLLLARPEHAKRARHGYCRGQEPVEYVEKIRSLYEDYVKIAKR